MEMFEGLLFGFKAILLDPHNLLFCFVGVLIGTLIGVLPGIGPVGAIGILIPFTFHTTALQSIVMLGGIYYGAMYGGSTTSILVKIPGEAASVITCMDGYQMALQGRAGPALGMAAIGSFIAGTIAILALNVVSVPLAKVAIRFGPPEYFAMVCAGLFTFAYVGQGSTYKALMMSLVGIILAYIGLDPIQGSPRFSSGIPELYDGIDLVPVAMGLFGISELLENTEKAVTEKAEIFCKVKNLMPTVRDWVEARWAILRGSIVGLCLGVLPGGGAVLASFLSYSIEKKVSKTPERFGKGAIEGVAGPESANNSGAIGSLIPLLTLGIPPNVVMAMLFSAFLIHGIQPGPLLLKDHPDVFWGVLASFYVGNVMLLILNLPLVGMWIQILKIPQKILFPVLYLLCLVGAYSVNHSTFDIYMMLLFGIFGYVLKKYDYEGAPLILGFVLAPLLETNFRQSLVMSDGSFMIFLSRPVSLGILLLVFVLALLSFLTFFKGWRQEYKLFKEKE
ncbi:MAG: tripartite tricarboxylate transporter permease [Desulfobacteraceae bacterium]|nr:MAG: tripartite tricarboxylate transporter permease [Desulfobacteraceae bacterium]